MTTSVSSVTQNSASNATQLASPQVDQNEFMNLMVTQMQNQNPLDPMDDTQFLAQLAQFSSLQQMTQVNTTLTSLASTLQSGQVSSLLGTTVTAQPANSSTPISGQVSAIVWQNQKPMLQIGNQVVDPSTVTQITASSE